MSIWNKISELAKEFLDDSPTPPVNLSKVSREVNRPNNSTSRLGVRAVKVKAVDISDIQVLPEYRFILEAVKEGCPALFVTGKAGTGKSTLIRYITAQIKRCAVVAPTAIAAINVGGSTIHSFFGIPPRTLNPDDVFDPNRHMRPVLENLEALIVDEVSMVSPDIIDCMNNCLQKVKGNKRPFGGVPIVFVGDILQLPPVVSQGAESVYYTHRYESPYFYSAEIFQRIEILPLELKKVFRQRDEQFIAALDQIRCSRNLSEALDLLNKNCLSPDRADEAICLVPTNAGAKSINEDKLQRLVGEIRCFDAIYTGNLEAGKVRFPAPDRLNLKIGAKIIFVKNNKPTWLNGTLGEIVAIDSDSLRVKVQETGNIVSVSRVSWEKIKYSYNYEKLRIESVVVGSFTQFPVSLGWAITIHKSQGMTMDSVKIDLGRGAFCAGQTYVALSRCKTLKGIHLMKRLRPNDIQVDETVIEFYRKLGFFHEDAATITPPDIERESPCLPEEKNNKKQTKAGEAWTDAEETKLIEEFRSGMNVGEIAEAHGRSRGAIHARLARKGLVDPHAKSYRK